MDNNKNISHGILLGIVGLMLSIVVTVATGVWVVAGLKAEIAELRGALYVHIGSHQHGIADASPGDESDKAE